MNSCLVNSLLLHVAALNPKAVPDATLVGGAAVE
jgi:hypothetical protein